MKIIFIGDIFGKPGRRAVSELLPKLVNDKNPDFVIGNCENVAHGSGVTEKTVRFLFENGFDLLTAGNHVFDNRRSEEVFKEFEEKIIRPANYPPGLIGIGHNTITNKSTSLGL